MKFLAFILIILPFASIFGQKKNFSTKIEKAEKVEIKDGKVNIATANNVLIGTVIINYSIKTNILLKSFVRTFDTATNIYTTVIELTSSNNGKTFIDVNLIAEFDSPVDDANASGIVTANNLRHGLSPNNTTYELNGSLFSTTDGLIKLIVKSKNKVFVKLSGIDGVLP